MMNFTEAELDTVDIKSGDVLGQMHKIYDEKQKANAANQPKPDRIYELCAAITAPRKPLPHITGQARNKTAPTATRRDRRQAPLPMASWSFGHLAIEAENGNSAALAELQSRGFARTAPNSFTRPA